MSDEKPTPFAENERAQMLLARLRLGPASTLDLQKGYPLIHVARQVWELRHWYGFQIKTGRLPNNVAVYTLMGGPVKPPEVPGQEPAFFTEPPVVPGTVLYADKGTSLDPNWTHPLGGANWYDESLRIYRTSDFIDTDTVNGRAFCVPVPVFAPVHQKVDWVEVVTREAAYQIPIKVLLDNSFAFAVKGVMHVCATVDLWKEL